MRLELTVACLLAGAAYVAGPVLGQRDGLALMVAMSVGLGLAALEITAGVLAGQPRPQGCIHMLLAAVAKGFTVGLVHCAVSRAYLLPFTPRLPETEEVVTEGSRLLPPTEVRTLNRRPLAAAMCLAFAAGGVHLILEFTGASPSPSADYARLGAVYVAVAPVLATLTLLGGRVAPPDFAALAVATPVILIATFTRYNALALEWSLRSLLAQMPGIPLQDAARDVLSALAVVLALHLVAHAHVLCLLSPSLPPAPPPFWPAHFALVARVLRAPPNIDARVLSALVVAKPPPRYLRLVALATPRELRITLTAINGWYAAMTSLMSEVDGDITETLAARRRALSAAKLHLVQCYEGSTALERAITLCTVPLNAEHHLPFYLFSAIVTRLCPLFPFLEVCKGFAIDGAFVPLDEFTRCRNLEAHLPIVTLMHLEAYASAVGGGLATAACYAAWSTLDPSPTPLRPVEAYTWSGSVHPDAVAHAPGLAPGTPVHTLLRAHTIVSARIAGRGMHLVAIAANASRDAAHGRVYLPLASFKASCELLDLLRGQGAPQHVFIPVLRRAEEAREDTANSIDGLPPAVHAAVRAAIAAAYVPACCLWNGAGETGKSCTCNPTRAVLQAIWRPS